MDLLAHFLLLIDSDSVQKNELSALLLVDTQFIAKERMYNLTFWPVTTHIFLKFV